MGIQRCLAVLAIIAACSCTGHRSPSTQAELRSSQSADPEHFLIVSTGKRCPIPKEHLPGMIAAWEQAAGDKCGARGYEVLVAPTPIMVTASQLCFRAYDSASYFTDVQGRFKCR